MPRRLLHLLVPGLFLAGNAHAQQPAPVAPPACAAPEHRQFDFWVGEWRVVKPDGSPAGSSRVERILGGCVVFENWTGAGGSEGKSFNTYDPATGRWEQYWVDQSGNRLRLSGGVESGRMVLTGAHDTPDPKTKQVRRERITWTPNPDGSVRQLWEASDDGGKSWAVSFDGLYRKASAE